VGVVHVTSWKMPKARKPQYQQIIARLQELKQSVPHDKAQELLRRHFKVGKGKWTPEYRARTKALTALYPGVSWEAWHEKVTQ